MGFGELFFVVVHCPEIHHDDGILGDEIAFIPIILNDEMVLSHLVDGSPSQGFLHVRDCMIQVRYLDDGPDVGKVVLVVECWGTIGADNPVQFLMGFPDSFGILQ